MARRRREAGTELDPDAIGGDSTETNGANGTLGANGAVKRETSADANGGIMHHEGA